MTAGKPRGAQFPLRLAQVQTARGREAAADRNGADQSTGRDVLRPQRPLQLARDGALQRVSPAGLGMDSADVRRRMVLRLRRGGICHEGVLDAMAIVPRHQFIDAALVAQAYEDTSLPIGHAQTISKPSVVARMIELLFDGATARRSGHLGRVLEIGTGCGYQAAILSRLGQFVISMERIKPLHDRARRAIGTSCADRLRLVFGDGMLGHAPNAPYDCIIAAAGGDALPEAWLDQLAVGGRLVVPTRQPGEAGQVLTVVDRTEQGIQRSVREAVNFVPLKSGLIG